MSTEQKKVLIVEDEKDLADALGAALSYENFSTFIAENGQEGIAVALKEHPDLILLDIIMPKLDGIGVLKKLRDDEWGKHAKVIVLTALDDMGKIAEVVEEGGVEYVVKSQVSLGDIVEKVKYHLKV